MKAPILASSMIMGTNLHAATCSFPPTDVSPSCSHLLMNAAARAAAVGGRRSAARCEQGGVGQAAHEGTESSHTQLCPSVSTMVSDMVLAGVAPLFLSCNSRMFFDPCDPQTVRLLLTVGRHHEATDLCKVCCVYCVLE